jgi:hypothetical protein
MCLPTGIVPAYNVRSLLEKVVCRKEHQDMTRSQWIECISGLVSGGLGLLMLCVFFFGPGITYQSSSTNGTSVSGTTSYAQVAGGVVPIFLLFGLPLLGIALGASFHAVRTVLAARIVLWASTIMLVIFAVLALLSISPWLFPSVILALIASSLAMVHQRPATG